MTPNLVPCRVDAPYLHGVVIRPLARQCGSTDNGEARSNRVLGVQFKQSLGVSELGLTPGLRASRGARAIGAPLGIIVPKEQQPRQSLGHPHRTTFAWPAPSATSTDRAKAGIRL